MALLYLDTSAFMKLYLPEKGSNWLQSYILNNQIVISELILVESGGNFK